MNNPILVIEDNPVILKLLSEILTRKGYEVKTAEDGLKALNLMEEYTPEIIFTDLVLPKINGEMLCNIIRSKSQFNDTYLIILSGIVAEAELNLESLGVDACIAKGRNIEKNVTTVLEKIESGQLRSEEDKTYGFTDIHSREAIVSLLDTKRHLEVIFANLSEGVVEITPEGIILKANAAAEAMLSTIQDKLIGDRFFSFFKDQDRIYVEKLLENADQNYQKTVEESRPLQVEDRYLALKICPLEEGFRPSCIIIIHDITKRKHAEEERELVISELRQALNEVKTLQGLLPICAKCKKIRDDRDKGYWKSLESYFREHSDVSFSHGICSSCAEELYGDEEWYHRTKAD